MSVYTNLSEGLPPRFLPVSSDGQEDRGLYDQLCGLSQLLYENTSKIKEAKSERPEILKHFAALPVDMTPFLWVTNRFEEVLNYFGHSENGIWYYVTDTYTVNSLAKGIPILPWVKHQEHNIITGRRWPLTAAHALPHDTGLDALRQYWSHIVTLSRLPDATDIILAENFEGIEKARNELQGLLFNVNSLYLPFMRAPQERVVWNSTFFSIINRLRLPKEARRELSLEQSEWISKFIDLLSITTGIRKSAKNLLKSALEGEMPINTSFIPMLNHLVLTNFVNERRHPELVAQRAAPVILEVSIGEIINHNRGKLVELILGDRSYKEIPIVPMIPIPAVKRILTRSGQKITGAENLKVSWGDFYDVPQWLNGGPDEVLANLNIEQILELQDKEPMSGCMLRYSEIGTGGSYSQSPNAAGYNAIINQGLAVPMIHAEYRGHPDKFVPRNIFGFRVTQSMHIDGISALLIDETLHPVIAHLLHYVLETKGQVSSLQYERLIEILKYKKGLPGVFSRELS